jgi:hypothetical protein
VSVLAVDKASETFGAKKQLLTAWDV